MALREMMVRSALDEMICTAMIWRSEDADAQYRSASATMPKCESETSNSAVVLTRPQTGYVYSRELAYGLVQVMVSAMVCTDECSGYSTVTLTSKVAG
eukprot:1746291-Rhodomonas_salina.2